MRSISELMDGLLELTAYDATVEPSQKPTKPIERSGRIPTATQVEAMLRCIDPDCDYPVWFTVCAAIDVWENLTENDGYGLFVRWSSGELHGTTSAKFNGEDDCRTKWDSVRADKSGGAGIGSLIHIAREHGYTGPIGPSGAETWAGYPKTTDPIAPPEKTAEPTGPVPFTDLMNETPTPQAFLIGDILPKGLFSTLSAHGGTGKSMVAMDWGFHIATRTPIWSRCVEQATFIHLSCEDDRAEITRRVHRIKVQPSTDAARYWDLTDTDRPLMRIKASGGVDFPEFWKVFTDYLLSIPGHKFVVLDSTYNLLQFDSQAKVDEGLVKQAIEHLNRLCRQTNSTIVALWHPSRAGLARGDASGWAVAWDNAPRSRLSLTEGKGTDRRRGNGIREGITQLRVEKLSGGKRPKPIDLVWNADGLLEPAPRADWQATQAADDNAAEHKLYEVFIPHAIQLALQGCPYKRDYRIDRNNTWVLDAIRRELDLTKTPDEAALKACLARAAAEGVLEYRGFERSKSRRAAGKPAGYYPTDKARTEFPAAFEAPGLEEDGGHLDDE